MCGIGKVLGSIAKVAAPVAGAYFGGPLGAAAASALTSKVSGGSWGDALKSGALSGLTAFAAPALGDAFSGAFPETASALGMSPATAADGSGMFGSGGGLSMGNIGGDAAGSAAGSSGGTSFLPQGFNLNLGGDVASSGGLSQNSGLSSLFSQGAQSAAGSSGGLSSIPVVGSLLGKGAQWASDNPLTTALVASQLYSGYAARQDADKQKAAASTANAAQQAQQAASWQNAINTPPLDRQANDMSGTNWNTYGYGPEKQFFKNSQISPSSVKYMAQGGPVDVLGERVRNLKQFPKKQGKITGQGDGMSDKVPAMLSDGEFVFPADAVSHLGNGSTDAGAKVLQDVISHIRKAKTKATKQPNPVQVSVQ